MCHSIRLYYENRAMKICFRSIKTVIIISDAISHIIVNIFTLSPSFTHPFPSKQIQCWPLNQELVNFTFPCFFWFLVPNLQPWYSSHKNQYNLFVVLIQLAHKYTIVTLWGVLFTLSSTPFIILISFLLFCPYHFHYFSLPGNLLSCCPLNGLQTSADQLYNPCSLQRILGQLGLLTLVTPLCNLFSTSYLHGRSNCCGSVIPWCISPRYRYVI